MKWTKNGSPFTDNVEQTPDFCKIKLKKTTRADQGEYQCELANDTGKELVPITIKVIGMCLKPHVDRSIGLNLPFIVQAALFCPHR